MKDNKCAISTNLNRFFSAELAQHNEITATREGIADWETFTMEKLDSAHVAFKAANGKYLSLDEKSLQIFAVGEMIGRQETFEMVISNK
jgi:hypothetical protein